MEKMFTQSIVYLKRKSSREETKFNRFCGECIGNFLLFPNTKDKICIEKIRYGDRLILRSTFSGPFSKIYTWYDKRFHKQRKKGEKKSEGKREMRDCSDSIFIFSRNVYGTHTWACADLIYEQDVLAYAENCIRPMNREGLRPILKFCAARAHVNSLVPCFSFSCSRFFRFFRFFVFAVMARQPFETRSKAEMKSVTRENRNDRNDNRWRRSRPETGRRTLNVAH